jgi:Family of unknown function (DUF6098)
VTSLDDLVQLVEGWDGDLPLYVRWTRNLDRDLVDEVSRDELTGIELPGLSANCLAVEPWWGDRSTHAWLGRKLYDYRHLPHRHGEGTRPWVLTGREAARGPDNEPLITNCEAIAEITDEVISQASDLVAEQPGDWGTLDRADAPEP